MLYSGYLFDLEWILVVYSFQIIGSFHLNCQIYMWRVVHSISLISMGAIGCCLSYSRIKRKVKYLCSWKRTRDLWISKQMKEKSIFLCGRECESWLYQLGPSCHIQLNQLRAQGKKSTQGYIDCSKNAILCKPGCRNGLLLTLRPVSPTNERVTHQKELASSPKLL